MSKNKNLIKNAAYNFRLRKRPTIFIGIYILIGTLFIKTTIEGFSTDSSPFGFLTVNFLENFIFIITLLVVLFSILALFFGNRKYERKIGNKIWNVNSRKQLWFLVILTIIMYVVAFYFLRNGTEQFIIPSFLITYGLTVVFLNFSKIKELNYFSMVIFLLGILALYIPVSGYIFLFALGISHLIYGMIKKKN
jgi:hypothetical protein